MKRKFRLAVTGFLLLNYGIPIAAISQTIKEEFKSIHTADTYEIIIKTPEGFDGSKPYHLVFFTDADINSGKTILNQPAEAVKNCILIGIAHKGDWDMKRRRDFIPSETGGYSDKNFGKAESFFLFLKNELIPYISKKFPNQKSSVIIGHSFGGLLALYISLKDNKLFDHYYAISPSVWANYYELKKIEQAYALKNRNYNAAISIYAGSLEFLNKVLSSSRDYHETVSKRNYQGLKISFEVISGVNHYGIVSRVMPEIFRVLQ